MAFLETKKKTTTTIKKKKKHENKRKDRKRALFFVAPIATANDFLTHTVKVKRVPLSVFCYIRVAFNSGTLKEQ